MINKLKYFIAARYVRSPKSHSVINIISGVSIVAMAVPVAAVVLLLSIFNGLEDMTRDMFLAVDADISITPAQGTTFSEEAIERAALLGVDGVEVLSFVLEQGALAELGERRAIVNLTGVDEHFLQVIPIAERIMVGSFTTYFDGICSLVAAQGVMQDLGMLNASAIGQQLRLYAINRARISTLLPIGGYTRREMPLMGIYSIVEDERSRLYTSLEGAQSLFNYAGKASSVVVRIGEEESVDGVASALQDVVGEEFVVRTREQSNSIYRLMALEKWGVFAIAVMVMLVASLSIVGTLVMVLIDKKDDIETLRTLGATRHFIRGIFIGEGRLMALLSLVLGLVLGAGLALLQQHFGFVGIDAQTLQVNAYPVEVHLQDILLTVAAYAAVSYIVVKLTVRALMRDNI